MKTLLLSMLLMTAPVAFAAEGAGGHGGDPFEVYAEPYPDTAKLDVALHSVLDKVATSKIPANIKDEIADEIMDLRARDKFLYLESLLIVEAETTDTYRLPSDLRTFTSLGGMTSHVKGSPVYLSKRTLRYSSDEFGRLLLHEVLHHVLETSLGDSETFINSMVNDVWVTGGSAHIVRALELGYDLAPGAPINIAQVFASNSWRKLWMQWCNRKDIFGQQRGEASCNREIDSQYQMLKKKFASDASEVSFLEAADVLGLAMQYVGVFSGSRNAYYTNTKFFMQKSIEQSGATFVNYGSCHVRPGLFRSCPASKQVKLKEFIKK